MLLSAGSLYPRCDRSVTITLNGTRQTPDWALTNALNLGSKFLAAVNGGRIDLHGQPVAKRCAAEPETQWQ